MTIPRSQRGDFVYLASPFSHKDPLVQKERYKQVARKAGELMLNGYIVFCPIAHTCPIETYGPPGLKSKDGDFWLRQDYAVLDMVDAVLVYKLPGWEESYGIREEINRAKRNGQPVRYLEDDTV